jgi:hypothetical protein
LQAARWKRHATRNNKPGCCASAILVIGFCMREDGPLWFRRVLRQPFQIF